MAPATVSETVLWVCVRASCTAPRLAVARLGRACGTSGSTTQRTVECAASEPRIREGAGSDVFSRAEGACFPADPTGGLGEEVGTPLAVGGAPLAVEGAPLAAGSWSGAEEGCEPSDPSVRGAEEAGFGSVAEPGSGRASSGRILGLLGWSVGEVAGPRRSGDVETPSGGSLWDGGIGFVPRPPPAPGEGNACCPGGPSVPGAGSGTESCVGGNGGAGAVPLAVLPAGGLSRADVPATEGRTVGGQGAVPEGAMPGGTTLGGAAHH
jgi:hypothetical protein